MDNIIVLHRDELSEIIHESVMNALRAFKEEENAPDSEFYTRKEVAAKWHVDEITVCDMRSLATSTLFVVVVASSILRKR